MDKPKALQNRGRKKIMTKRRFKKGIQSIILTVIMVLTMVPLDLFMLEVQAVTEYTKTFDFSTGQKSDDNTTLSLIDATDNERKSVVIVTDIQNGWISRWSVADSFSCLCIDQLNCLRIAHFVV